MLTYIAVERSEGRQSRRRRRSRSQLRPVSAHIIAARNREGSNVLRRAAYWRARGQGLANAAAPHRTSVASRSRLAPADSVAGIRHQPAPQGRLRLLDS